MEDSTTGRSEYDVVCVCCGKKFVTTDPLQSCCRECIVDLAEFESNKKKPDIDVLD